MVGSSTLLTSSAHRRDEMKAETNSQGFLIAAYWPREGQAAAPAHIQSLVTAAKKMKNKKTLVKIRVHRQKLLN